MSKKVMKMKIMNKNVQHISLKMSSVKSVLLIVKAVTDNKIKSKCRKALIE
jgi:hypothetical protein